MRIKTVWFPVALILLMIVVSRCYYDSEEFLFPQIGACDTTRVSFDTSIVPIVQSHCLLCHGEVTAGQNGTFKLVNYQNIKDHADRLVGSVSWETGYVQMPLGLPKLDNCQIEIIRIWVNAGALQN